MTDARANSTGLSDFFLMNSMDISGRPTLLSGISWLKTAFVACRAHPWPLAVVAIFYLCTMGLLSIFPLIGSF